MQRKIKKVAVIGSGVMGGGIAALLASAGLPTLLLDIVPPDLSEKEKADPKARNRIVKGGFDKMMNAKPAAIMQKKDADLITLGNMEDDFDRIAECDWIVEVVVENLKIKKSLFERIDGIRRKGSIVSSNTSGIPLHAMSEGCSGDFKQHFLGTHFFNPVRNMHLLEIIPGKETLDEVLAFVANFGERRLGKGIVWAKDTPNFIGNRIGIHGMVTSMQLMLEEGFTIPEVDALFGLAMGRPKTAMFKTADLVGLDVMGHVADNTYEMVPEDEERESFVLPEFVRAMIDKGMLGKKANGGFYKTELTEKWEIVRKVVDPKTFEYDTWGKPEFPCLEEAKKAGSLAERIKAVVYGDDRGARFAWKALAGQLIYAANRIPEISDTVVQIDNAMRWGYNFELGPFETWDAIGVEDSVKKMKADGFDVPEKIEKMLADGNPSFYRIQDGTRLFFDFSTGDYRKIERPEIAVSLQLLKAQGRQAIGCDSASLVDVGEGVYCLEFHTKMNSLNDEMIRFAHECLDFVEENGVGLVIGNEAGGMPAPFSAGADLKSVGAAVKQGRFAEIEKMVEQLQRFVQRCRYAPFPVVAAPFGLALGGGCEVCLGADRIVAHAELYMGLVEFGVGLIPAGGGCMNLWKKFLASIPEAVSDFDLGKLFLPCFMNIALAKVSSSAAEARANGFLGPQDRIVFNRDHLIGEAKREVLRMASDGYAPPVKRDIRVFGQSAQGMVNSELHNMKSGGFVTEHDVFLAKRIATVLSGGEVRTGSRIDEEVILRLERRAFMDFLREEKSQERIRHMMETGKPLRN
ncbi:MAG: 3-hydroxyacyl-CoA dehydrogenase/enoyl-CoA hydratase family protein [Desulfobacteraceae bacterium]|nr:3-hydroxyacyl-CoA dehydrogenase/enoyl-CoA hydratase family protein [Desulfobacteraceae bacterium]